MDRVANELRRSSGTCGSTCGITCRCATKDGRWSAKPQMILWTRQPFLMSVTLNRLTVRIEWRSSVLGGLLKAFRMHLGCHV